MNMGIQDGLEKQAAALIHLATTCDDNGLAMCIENVALELERMAELASCSLPVDDGEPMPAGHEVSERSSIKDRDQFVEELGTKRVLKRGIRIQGNWITHRVLANQVGLFVKVYQGDFGLFVLDSEGRACFLE